MKKILIKVDNSYAYFYKRIEKLHRFIKEKIRKKSSYVVRAYNSPPTRKHAFLKYDKNWYRLPTGLLAPVLHVMDKYKVKYNLKNLFKDDNIKPKHILYFIRRIRNTDKRLWEHQKRAIKKALILKRGIINHATAAGKTLTLCGIIYCIEKPTLYIIHRKGLAQQSAEEIEEYTWFKTGLFAEGYRNLDELVTVATVQSLMALKRRDEKRYYKFVRGIKVLIAEEVHHSGSSTWLEIIYDCVNAPYKLGFTGTAYRTDSGIFLLRATTGNIIDKATNKELTEKGIISKLTVYIKDPKCDKIKGDYYSAKKYGIIDSMKRNILIAKYAMRIADKGKTCIILTGHNHLKHVWNLMKIFKQCNFDSVKCMTGKEPLISRRAMKQDFINGKFGVLIATTILDEGENIPTVNVLILAVNSAAKDKQSVNVIQRTGRVLRKTKTKHKAYMIIFKDTHHRILLRHSEETIGVLKNENCFKFKNFN